MNTQKDIITYANNGRRISQEEAETRYGIVGIYTQHHSLSYCELYSGTDKDPVMWAHLDSERFAVDDLGNKLPYDVTTSFKALKFGDNKISLEMLSKRDRKLVMSQQILMVHVVVFKSLFYKDMYNRTNSCLTMEYQYEC